MTEGPEQEVDFLDDGANAVVRENLANTALAFAQNHLFFETDPRAKKLLEFWKNNVVNRRIPPGSPLDAYAAAEAVRAFVGEIERQVEVAKRGSIS